MATTVYETANCVSILAYLSPEVSIILPIQYTWMLWRTSEISCSTSHWINFIFPSIHVLFIMAFTPDNSCECTISLSPPNYFCTSLFRGYSVMVAKIFVFWLSRDWLQTTYLLTNIWGLYLHNSCSIEHTIMLRYWRCRALSRYMNNRSTNLT